MADIIPFPSRFAEDDTPSLLERTASGIIVHARWHYNGELHRVGGPAVIRSDRQTGIRTLEEWWQFGTLHRENDPAIIERDARTGAITREEWRWPERRSMTIQFPGDRSPRRLSPWPQAAEVLQLWGFGTTGG